MLWKDFQRPQRLEVDDKTLTDRYARFSAQPFERGFGTTLGNALRRCLLSSIEGAAITAVQIEGVLHEFSSIPGVVDDVTDIILNLKQIPLRIHGDEPRFLSLDVKGPRVVTAGQFVSDANVEVCNPDAPIATLNEGGHLKLQAQVRWGRGFATAEKNFDESMGIGWIPMDSVHSPVSKVNYRVEAARLGRTTDYERLLVEVWTNGTLTPQEAVSLASDLLRNHLGIFVSARTSAAEEIEPVEDAEEAALEPVLSKGVDELSLSVRTANCLKNAGVHTVGELVQKTRKEMLETKNLGKKSLEELESTLIDLGLGFRSENEEIEE